MFFEHLPTVFFLALLATAALRWWLKGDNRELFSLRGRKFRTCPRCTASLRWQAKQCDVCQWPAPAVGQERPEQVHHALHRMLYRFRALGVLSETRFQALLKSSETVLKPSADGMQLKPAAEEKVEVEVAKTASEPPQVQQAPKPRPTPIPATRTVQKIPTPRPAPVATRAQAYAARRHAAAVEVAAEPPAPPKPKRDWAQVFRGFLEQHNIMWGELVGGLLIVCCSIALVISFWAEIAERPLLKFGIFSGVSAALFAAGFYTDRRWKIHTTSHGVLIIAILLVPLNFLAIAAFTAASPPTDLLSLLGEGLSLALFAALTYFAARVLTPHAPWATMACVMVASLMQLLVRRFAGPEAPLLLIYGLALAPLACYALATSVSLRRSVLAECLNAERTSRHLTLFGLCLFATLLPLALLLHKTGEIAGTLQQLSPLLAVLGGPALATALVCGRRLEDQLVALRVMVNSAGVLGGMMLIASVALAWPLPAALVAAAVVNALVWLALAGIAKQPRAMILAAAFVTIGWLVGAAVIADDASWTAADSSALFHSIFSAAGGARLAPLVAVFAGVAVVCRRYAGNEAFRAWAMSAAAAVLGSIALLFVFGFGRVGDPASATWYFAVYAALATAAAAALDHRNLSWASAVLWFVAIVQGMVFRYADGWSDTGAWVIALLVHATTLALVSAGLKCLWSGRSVASRSALDLAALGTSAVAAAVLVSLGWMLEYAQLAVYFLWLAMAWLALAWLTRSDSLFVAFQVALAVSLGVAVRRQLAHQPWAADAGLAWYDPWFLQGQGIALALSAIVWRVLRLAGGRIAQARQRFVAVDFRSPPWATFDRAAGGVVFVLTLLLAAYAALPGMGQELSPPVNPGTRTPVPAASFELPGIDATHAAGLGSWGLLAATSVLAVVGLWDRHAAVRLLDCYLLGAAACLLAASSFADQTATASALRWLLGGFTLLAAVPIVARQYVGPWLRSIGVDLDPPPKFVVNSLGQAGRGTVVALIVGLYLAIAGFVCIAAFRMGPASPGAVTLLWWTGALAAAAGAAWLATGWYATREQGASGSNGLIQLGRSLAALAAAAPLLIVTAYVVATKLTARPLLGPDPSSWFAALGNAALYGGPLALFAVVLLAFAIRETSSRYAFSFGLLSLVVATLVYLLELAKVGRPLDAVAWIEVAQLNAAVAATVALGWWAAIASRHGLGSSNGPRPVLMQVLAALGLTFAAETLLAGSLGIFADPNSLTWQTSVASVGGLVATALAAIAMWLTTKPAGMSFNRMHLGGFTLLAVTLAANVAVRFDTGQWEAYHTLLVATALAGWVFVVVPERWRSTTWTIIFASLATMLALRGLPAWPKPPGWPWWSLAGLLAVYGVLVRLAWLNVRRWPLWLSAPVLVLAGHLWWWNAVPYQGANEALLFFDLSAVLLSIAAVVSVVVEFTWQRRASESSEPRHWLIGLHRVAVWLGIVNLLFAAAVHLFFAGRTAAWSPFWWFGYVALCVVLIAALATLWDRHARWPVAAFYCLGLAAVGRYLATLRLEGDMFIWAFTLALAAFVLATSYLWSRREAIAAWAMRLGAPQHLPERLNAQAWMVSANGVASFIVIWLVVVIEFTHAGFTERMTVAYGVLACALALALLAAGRAETVLRYVALATGALFAVAFAWAWIPPTLGEANLHRLVAASVALAAVIPVYGTLLVKIWRRSNRWVEAAQQTIPVLVVAAGTLLAVTLVTEVVYFLNGKDAPLVWPAVLAVALAVAALAVSCLAAATLPGRDPLNLSERGRTAYVYAAEVCLALLLLHIRVTMPWLFTGWFEQFWPFIVMLIAFVGVGLSEWFARRQQHVLSEPLGNTGILLPLLPLIGFWMAAPAGQYALLLISVGALYTTMSVLRKSPLFMGLALLAFNGSLWTMLHSVEGLGLLQHPQFWLIPPAACVLVGAELNRSRMTSEQLSSLRYAAAIMIYAASTADIFINGVGTAMWLPMVLAGLSILGVFAGILLRVRAFLFLGVAFLSVALFSVVWHAAVELERTWIWWVAGIVAGLAIIVLFGLFEKKRDEALALVESLKKWEA